MRTRARVGEAHRHVDVFLHPLQHCRHFGVEVERRNDSAPLQQGREGAT
jgi:hypothetical protein